MNNKALKKMESILNIGAVLLFIAGIIILLSNMKVWSIQIFLIAITLIYGVVAIALEKMDMNKSSKGYFILCLCGILVSYIYLGSTILANFWQSLSENGNALFIISINILIIILTTLLLIKYKNYQFIHLIYWACFMIILEFFALFDIDNFYPYLTFNVLLLVFNIFNIGKNLPTFSKYLTYFLAFSFLLDMENFALIPLTIIAALFFLNFMMIARGAKDDETNIFTSIVIIFYLFIIYTNYMHLFPIVPGLLAITAIISFIYISINRLAIFSNKFCQLASNIFANVLLLWIIITNLALRDWTLLLISSIILVVSLISNRRRTNTFENYLLPFKMMLVIETGLMFINNAFLQADVLILLLINLMALQLAMMSKNKIDQYGYLLFVGLTIVQIGLNYASISPVMLIALEMILLADYLVANHILESKTVKNILYVIFILALLIFTSITNFKINYLITLLYFGFMLWKVYPHKFKFGVTIPAFYFALNAYLHMMTLNPDIIFILSRVMLLLLVYIFGLIIDKNDRWRDSLVVIALFLLFIESIMYDSAIILSYSLGLAIVMLILGFMKEKYKALLSLGIVFSIFSILRLMSIRSLSSKTFAFFLAVFGLLIIIYVIIQMKRELNNPTPETTVHEAKREVNYHNYCANWGQKIDKKDKFCAHCGHKVSWGWVPWKRKYNLRRRRIPI